MLSARAWKNWTKGYYSFHGQKIYTVPTQRVYWLGSASRRRRKSSQDHTPARPSRQRYRIHKPPTLGFALFLFLNPCFPFSLFTHCGRSQPRDQPTRPAPSLSPLSFSAAGAGKESERDKERERGQPRHGVSAYLYRYGVRKCFGLRSVTKKQRLLVSLPRQICSHTRSLDGMGNLREDAWLFSRGKVLRSRFRVY